MLATLATGVQSLSFRRFPFFVILFPRGQQVTIKESRISFSPELNEGSSLFKFPVCCGKQQNRSREARKHSPQTDRDNGQRCVTQQAHEAISAKNCVCRWNLCERWG